MELDNYLIATGLHFPSLFRRLTECQQFCVQIRVASDVCGLSKQSSADFDAGHGQTRYPNDSEVLFPYLSAFFDCVGSHVLNSIDRDRSQNANAFVHHFTLPDFHARGYKTLIVSNESASLWDFRLM
jgi:hypothetical protein